MIKSLCNQSVSTFVTHLMYHMMSHVHDVTGNCATPHTSTNCHISKEGLSFCNQLYYIIITSFTCPCRRHGGLMFHLISVLPKHMFRSREDQSSVKQSFSLPHIMFRLINVSPKHIFLSGKDRSSASQSFSLPHIMFRLHCI